MEALIRRLWPLLRPRVVALLATQLKALAVRSHVPLSDDDAVTLALLVVEIITDLVDRDDVVQPALVAKAAAAISGSTSAPAQIFHAPPPRAERP